VTRRLLLFVTACSACRIGAGGRLWVSPEGRLTIRVSGFRNSKGVLGAAVFQTPRGWPEDQHSAYRRGAVPIVGRQASIVFEPLSAGRYAVVVLHDENSNERLDRNFLGFPKEGFGFSNNPRVGLTAPSWNASSVEVGAPATEVEIYLIYK
jgi:uncharacterized protein (DUF2141 family)